MYQSVEVRSPDKQLIIFGRSVENLTNFNLVSWRTWLSMYKGYNQLPIEKDRWYTELRAILIRLFGEDTVDQIDRISTRSTTYGG